MAQGTLDKHKKNMNVDFIKNRVRPGDEGYEFDKQVDFETPVDEDASDNSWDDMDSSDDE